MIVYGKTPRLRKLGSRKLNQVRPLAGVKRAESESVSLFLLCQLYCANRKNCCVPEMGLVTVFCPLTTAGAGRLVVQTGELSFVVDCRVKPVELVGHVTALHCERTR